MGGLPAVYPRVLTFLTLMSERVCTSQDSNINRVMRDQAAICPGWDTSEQCVDSY